MDEVDRILKAWARETPDLDVSPLRVLSRVSRLARYLDFARREAFARLFCRSTKKAGPANEAGPKILRFPRSGEVLRPVGGNG